nr:bifunctional 4-hydroxy-2-oxoglutarate aldolase/2-dehydro-3-deoxy-phosphogluconate aldolase [Cohnella lubricantis]
MIYRGLKADDCLAVTETLAEAGVRYFEVTMNTPNAADIIRLLRRRMGSEVRIGAGTALTVKQVRQVADAGAGFIISPNVNADVIRATKDAGMLSVPGAFTPTEVLRAWDSGADIIKIFPINVVGPEYIRQLRGPLEDIPFMGTGGVRLDMAEELFRAGVCSIGLSVHLLGPELVQNRDWKAVGRRALQFRDAARAASEAGL